MLKSSRFLARVFLVAALLPAIALPAFAAADRYFYDPGGRVVQRVGPDGGSTDYRYDPAGNVEAVAATGSPEAIVISAGSIPDMRRNDVRAVSLGGTALIGITVVGSHPGVIVTNLLQSGTAMSFRLAITSQVPLGQQSLTLQGAGGNVQLPFNVLPELAYGIEPSPITVGLDNIARRYTLVAGEVSDQPRTFSLSVLSPVTARATVSQVTIPAGELRADFGVLGLSAGATVLRFTNANLFDPIETTVWVYAGGGTPMNYSRALQISRGQPFAWPGSLGNFSLPLQISRGQPFAWSGNLGNYSIPLQISRGTPPWSLASTASYSTAMSIQRGVPWSTQSTGGLVQSGAIQVQRQ